jgi:hypothetical protein
MRAALASKWCLALSVCAAAVGGCQENQGPMGGPPAAAATAAVPRLSVASADAIAVAGPPAAGDPALGPSADVSQSDVIGWTVRGVSDDVILDRIGHARSTFHLSAGDEMRLRDAGVSDDVIRAMKATVWN